MKLLYAFATVLVMLQLFCGLSQQVTPNSKKSPLIEDIVELKDFKKLLRSRTNVLVSYIQNPKASADILKTLREVASAVKGQGTLVAVDCSGPGKKLCKKAKLDTSLPHQIKHYKDGEFHKDYDRKEVASSMIVFMRSPTGDLPWEEDSSAADIHHLLDYDSLTKFIKYTKKRAIIMFYAPWCGYCKSMKPDYAAAAADLKGEAILAAIDMSKPENTKAGAKFNITGFPTLLFFEKGHFKFPYEGPNSREALVSFIKDPSAKFVSEKKAAESPKESWSMTESDILHLTDDDFDSVISSESNVLVVFYAPWCGHCEMLKPKYENAAAKFKESGKSGIFAAVDATKNGDIAAKYGVKGYPTLKFFDEGEFKYDINYREEDKLVEFMENPTAPPPPPPEELPWTEEETKVIHLTKETFKQTLRKKKHALVIFYAPWCGFCKKAKPEINAAAEHFADEPRIAFAAVDCTQERELCSTYEVKGYPTIKYLSFYDKQQFDYIGSRTEASMVAFMKNPIAPSAPKTDSPKDQPSAPKEVLVLNDDNFSEAVGSSEPTLVMFYASWCGHCNKMKPAFYAAAEKLAQDGIKGHLALLECNDNTATAKKYNIESYPTLKLFTDGNSISEYDGNRTEGSFYDYIKKAIVQRAKDEL